MIECFDVKRSHVFRIYFIDSEIYKNRIPKDTFDTYSTFDNLEINLYMYDREKNIYSKNIRELKRELRRKTDEMDVEELKSEIRRLEINQIRSNRERYSNARENLLNFIILMKNSIPMKLDVEATARLNYSYYKYKNRLALRILLYPVGYFYKPSRVVLSSISLILIFGIVYWMLFDDDRGTDVMYFIYFSGISFFTIGFSDSLDAIKEWPLVYTKDILVLLEAGIGVVLSSSFVASLLNKYCSK